MPSSSRKPSSAKPADQLPLSVPQVGQPAPDFSLPGPDGRTHRLADYRSQWVVLYFYPKDNTSGCTQQACQFRDRMPDFSACHALVIGISPDDQTSHRKFIEKHQLNFLLLTDSGSDVCTRYGVWQEKSLYGRRYMGVVRTTFLIDPQGHIAYRWDKVQVSGHEQSVLNELNQRIACQPS